jgi:signal transduction histidine kinase
MGAFADLRSGTHAVSRTSGAKRPLQLVLVEDSDDDALLVIRELTRGGYEPRVHRVTTQSEFLDALEGGPWDIIVSDHSLPTYDGMSALADLQATGKDIPFILVSGTIGEAVAVSAMKAGAQDYVLKGDLTRLPVAVERELREKELREEQTRMREQLVISERMASAGTLAAGVAHEINNPLAVACANLEYLSDLLAQYTEAARDADEGKRMTAFSESIRDTREALDRIRDIVRDVKLFSRPEEETTGRVDVTRVVESAARMAWNEIRHRARLVKDYQPTPMALANESRLGQVVLNLIVNAAQAMPEGHADDHELRVTTRTGRNGQVVIEVADNGAGIAKEHLDRIFDPFFTTKPIGVGTGLGLSICQRIVTQLGGTIEVHSELGRGSLFRVRLLAAHQDHAQTETPSTPPAPPARARVIIVDDEPALGRTLSRALEDTHDVEATTSAKELLARIAAGERFDVIVSDLMMPEMTGIELYEHLERAAPEQARRVVFLTGGAFTQTAREFLAKAQNPTLEKPLQRKELLSTIADVVQRQGLR